jgi:hypothetical protein
LTACPILSQGVIVRGVTQMTSQSKISAQIINSEIFRRDKVGKPIGIMNLDKECTCKDCDPDFLFKLIKDLASVIDEYYNNPLLDPKYREELIDWDRQRRQEDFEKGLIKFLKSDNLSPNDSHYYSNFVEHYKGKIRRRKVRSVKKRGPEPPIEKVLLVGFLIHQFSNHMNNLKPTKALHYISHILIACGIEEGNHKTVFERIKKRHQRYWRDEYMQRLAGHFPAWFDVMWER